MTLSEIRSRYTPAILAEAVRRFGFDPASLVELEGSAFVYEGLLSGQACILKIAPGLWNPPEQVTGSTREQVLAEVEFVRYLANNGVPVALPVRSQTGNWVEVILLDDQACFLATCFEKAPGILLPDADEVEFTGPVLVEWGRLSGMMNRLSSRYRPSGAALTRLSWRSNDLLDFTILIPPEQCLVYQRRDEILAELEALPQDPDSYGLVHGDFHHGNFLVAGEKLTVFDFDAAEYFWYAGEVTAALYNCLPLPRSLTARRRAFALNFLDQFLRGYRQEKPYPDFWLQRIPLFLKFSELSTYAYFHKYWDLANLSARRAEVLADLRRRIEQEIPVVSFAPGDLEALRLAD